MTSQVAPVDLTEYALPQQTCDRGCGRPAEYVAKGCMDKEPVLMCKTCLTRGLEVIRNTVRMYQKLNHRVLICGDCHRPILHLETHLEIRNL